MNAPLRQIDHDALDAYCDGRLDAAARAEFEARLAREPLLRAEVQRQQQIDAALGRLFVSPAAPNLERIRERQEPIRIRPQVRRFSWRPLATAAGILLIVGGGWWQWQRLAQPPAGPMPKQTLLANYESEVSTGFKVAGKCWGDKEFAFVFWGKLAVAIVVAPPPPGVELLGIDYSNTMSPQTTMLMARVNGRPVIAYVDRKEWDKGPTTAPTSCSQMHIFRRELAEVVIYEVSALDQPCLLDLFKRTEMTPEWLAEYKKIGPPY